MKRITNMRPRRHHMLAIPAQFLPGECTWVQKDAGTHRSMSIRTLTMILTILTLLVVLDRRLHLLEDRAHGIGTNMKIEP